MNREGDDYFWQFTIVLVLVSGAILYWSGLSTIGFWPTCFIHLGLIGVYVLCIADFGRNSYVEVGVNLMILAILASILFPVVHRVQTGPQRHKSKQGLVYRPRVASVPHPSRSNPQSF